MIESFKCPNIGKSIFRFDADYYQHFPALQKDAIQANECTGIKYHSYIPPPTHPNLKIMDKWGLKLISLGQIEANSLGDLEKIYTEDVRLCYILDNVKGCNGCMRNHMQFVRLLPHSFVGLLLIFPTVAISIFIMMTAWFVIKLSAITRPLQCLLQNTVLINIAQCVVYVLIHWGRVTHICVSKVTIIVSDNGLAPERRQAIIWTNAGILLIGPLGTNFSEILIEILIFSFKKMCFKVSSAKWRPFCLGLNVLIIAMVDVLHGKHYMFW